MGASSLASGSLLASTVSAVELVWLGIGMVGLLVTLTNYHAVACDLERLVRSGRNGLTLLSGIDAMQAEQFRYTVLFAFCGAGVLAADAPGAPSLSPAAVVLIGSALLVVLDSVRARVNRRRQLDYEDQPWTGLERRQGSRE